MRFINKIIGLSLLVNLACTHEYTPEDEVKESWRIDVEMGFNDAQFWPEGQLMRVGVFEVSDSKQPIESVLINKPETDRTAVSISDVAEGVYTLKLYITEAGIYKSDVATIGTVNVNGNTEIEAPDITLLTYERVQKQVFNSCQVCHGGSSGEIAAGLNLTEDYSYHQLVNVEAVKDPKMSRVLPGSANYSYLLKVLQEDVSFDHSASASATEPDRQLIIDWINQGAKNN